MNNHRSIGKCSIPLKNADKRLDGAPSVAKWYNLERPSNITEVENNARAIISSKLNMRLSLDGGYHLFDEDPCFSSDLNPTVKKLWRSNIRTFELGKLNASGLLIVWQSTATNGYSQSPLYKRYGRSVSRSLSRSRSRSFSRSPSRDAENPGNNLYVTGLSPRITKRELEKHFASEGKVIDVNLVVDPLTRESRGFGFVTLEIVEEADRCVKYLDRSVVEGRVITVEKARRSRGRTPTPGRYLGLRTVRVRHRSSSYSSRRSPSDSPYRRSYSRSPYSSDRSRSRSYSPPPYRSQRRSYSRSHSPYSRSPVRRRDRSYSPYDSPDDRYYYRRHLYRSISPRPQVPPQGQGEVQGDQGGVHGRAILAAFLRDQEAVGEVVLLNVATHQLVIEATQQVQVRVLVRDQCQGLLLPDQLPLEICCFRGAFMF
ncbi:hypothetical protein K1719_019821 [Acacia pycnantha]|nr:hypothetical protein K1719_019821 [Acacia pycnantha]